MPTLSFQATLAKNRATWAASEDGTRRGLRKSVCDISIMISDNLLGCSCIAYVLLSRSPHGSHPRSLNAWCGSRPAFCSFFHSLKNLLFSHRRLCSAAHLLAT